MTNRRGFLKLVAPAAVAVPALAVGGVAALVTVPPTKLPRKVDGDFLTAESWNAIVDRINELSERAR
jgi:hypothetical protein